MTRYHADAAVEKDRIWLVGVRRAISLFIFASTLVLSACNQGPTGHAATEVTARLPTPTSTSTELPSFTDWRASYLASDGHLHVVALDGKQDMVGPSIAGMSMNGLNLSTAHIASDGLLLAYVGADGLKVIDIAGHATMNRMSGGGATELFWSPDSSQLALSDGQRGVAVMDTSGQTRRAPANVAETLGTVFGWTDNSHVAVALIPATQSSGDFATTQSFGVIDTTTWQVRQVASFSSPTLNDLYFSLLPGSGYALAYNRQFRADPFTPVADLINIQSGDVTPLPRIADILATGFGFTSVAWKPGSLEALVSTGFPGHLWLIDAGRDAAAQQDTSQSSAAYAAGWAPDGQHVVLSSGWQAQTNAGPYELDAATVGPQGIIGTTLLTNAAMSFPFLGFARTA